MFYNMLYPAYLRFSAFGVKNSRLCNWKDGKVCCFALHLKTYTPK